VSHSGTPRGFRRFDILYRVRKLRLLSLLSAVLLCRSQSPSPNNPVQNTTFENYPALAISSGKLQLTVMLKGATMANLLLADDPEKLNPFWNPMRMSRELGREARYEGGAGHFVCVDGFGPVSAEEKAAGLMMHGEAHSQMFTPHSSREGNANVLTMTAYLPIVQENFARTFRVIDGENVVAVESELTIELGFDHPVNWAEHATVGSPYLESGVTVLDLSGTRSRTRPYDQMRVGQTQRRIASGQDFTWPMAPGLDGHSVNLRETPANAHYLDHATTLLDPNRKIEWVTALNPKQPLVLGYLFRRAEYPWLQYWGNYPPTGKFARGLEFSTQPFDVPRREVISAGRMFDTPMFRWLPAKSRITTKFLLFYVQVPDGFGKVDDVKLEGGRIVLEDRAAAKQVTLTTAATLDEQ
jgi:hypothetical protein